MKFMGGYSTVTEIANRYSFSSNLFNWLHLNKLSLLAHPSLHPTRCKFLNHKRVHLLSPLLLPQPLPYRMYLNHLPKTCAREIITFLEIGKTIKFFSTSKFCFRYQAFRSAGGGVREAEVLNIPAFSQKQQELHVIWCFLCTKCFIYLRL